MPVTGRTIPDRRPSGRASFAVFTTVDDHSAGADHDGRASEGRRLFERVVIEDKTLGRLARCPDVWQPQERPGVPGSSGDGVERFHSKLDQREKLAD